MKWSIPIFKYLIVAYSENNVNERRQKIAQLPSMKKLKINLKWFKIINAQKYFWNWFFRSFGKTFVQTKGEGRESLLTKFAQNFSQTNDVIFVGNLLGINDLKSFRLDLKFFLEWYLVLKLRETYFTNLAPNSKLFLSILIYYVKSSK